MAIPIWAGRYIGLPFKDHGRDRAGLDCWGLVRLALAEQFGLALPSFTADYRRTTDMTNISGLIEREIKKWTPVEKGRESAGDIIILRLRGDPAHISLILGDKRMLHIESGINSAIENYSRTQWQDRIFGIFRYDRNAFINDSETSSGDSGIY